MGQLMWGRVLPGDSTQKCSRDDSTAEPDVRTLKVNVEVCDWEMQLIFRGNDCIPVSNIYLKGYVGCDDQVPAHIKTKYPT
jgi:hypothetical protein